MPLIIVQLLTLVSTQLTASEKRDSSTLIAISTRSRRVKPQDTLTTLKLRTIANVTTGVTPNLNYTAWPKTACSITASGEEISNSKHVLNSLKNGTKKLQLPLQ